jgi:hypothetical protein
MSEQQDKQICECGHNYSWHGNKLNCYHGSCPCQHFTPATPQPKEGLQCDCINWKSNIVWRNYYAGYALTSFTHCPWCGDKLKGGDATCPQDLNGSQGSPAPEVTNGATSPSDDQVCVLGEELLYDDRFHFRNRVESRAVARWHLSTIAKLKAENAQLIESYRIAREERDQYQDQRDELKAKNERLLACCKESVSIIEGELGNDWAEQHSCLYEMLVRLKLLP